MKRLTLIFFMASVALAGCKSGNKNGLSTDLVSNGKTPKMTFEEAFHDFGKITEGELVSYTFDFKNTGDGDLLIADAHGQCSCTVPKWPKEIIHPGDKGSINVSFDSNGKNGIVDKEVIIEANTNPKITKLKIQADIQKAPEKK